MGQWDLNRGKDIGVKINYALRKTLCRDAIYRVFRLFTTDVYCKKSIVILKSEEFALSQAQMRG